MAYAVEDVIKGQSFAVDDLIDLINEAFLKVLGSLGRQP
jgi:hypothetical protein